VRNAPLLLGFAACLGLVAASARAADPVPAQIPDLVGARALGLAAYRGLAAGNDGIFTNAASLAARRRYALEGMWFTDRTGADTALQAAGASVVDSETSSFTGGISFTRVLSGPWIGNLFHLPIAFPAGQGGLYLGATLKYLSLDGPAGDAIRAVNADVSAYWQASSLVSLGAAGYNLVPAGHKQVQPRGVGVGLAVGDDRRYHLSADWRGDLDRDPGGKLTSLYAVGGEILLGDLVPVRAGYLNDETRSASFVSAGVGIVLSSGVAVDLAYRQCIERSSDRSIAAALKIFVNP
jgi:opacity protein-like surface antigen